MLKQYYELTKTEKESLIERCNYDNGLGSTKYNDTNYNISYSLNYNTADNEDLINEQYKNITDAIIRMYNLKILGANFVNIILNVYDENNNVVIDDIVTVDIFDKCINPRGELIKLYAELESMKIENKIYKDFVTKYNADNLFKEYVKSLQE